MSKIDKSVLLPPTLVALLGLSGIAAAAQSDVSPPVQSLSVPEISIDSGIATHELSDDHGIAGTQCTSYSSGGTHCGHYSTGDQQKENFRFAHVIPEVRKFII
ncbi:hypothetical protein [Stenotrophomonas thermophila]|nr:hypothetical protein [Stenotrophomonas maltophilia]CRD47310.1 exported hypothetical protein [Stenotrophomonas maltophilia]